MIDERRRAYGTLSRRVAKLQCGCWPTAELARIARGVELRRTVGGDQQRPARRECRNEFAGDAGGVIDHEERCARINRCAADLAWCGAERGGGDDHVGAAHRCVG